MDSALTFQPSEGHGANDNRGVAITLTCLSLIWTLFIFSSLNYRNVSWFPWLFWSRVSLAVLGMCLAGFALTYGRRIKNLDTAFLLISLFIQCTHGFLEGNDRIEFYNFTGLIFPLMCLCFRGVISRWVRLYLVPSIVMMVIPMTVKAVSLRSSLGTLIDQYSHVLVGFFIGCLIARINSSKHEALSQLVHSKNLLLLEKKRQLADELYRGALIKREVLRLKDEVAGSAGSVVIGNLATQIAHDIRSPLAALKVTSNAIHGIREADRAIIQAAIGRINDIAEDLLRTSREYPQAPEPGRGSTFIHSTDVALIANETLAEIQKRFIDRKDLELVSKISTNLEKTEIDVSPIELRRVISNLIENAVEALVGAGVVSLDLKRERDFLKLAIQDTGVGITKENISRIGERGVSFGKALGNGLGLHYATQRMKAWQGELAIDSKVGKGTVVTLSFPT